MKKTLTHSSFNASAFASTFYFFADTQDNAKKNKKSLQAHTLDSAKVQCKLNTTALRTDRRAADNSTYKKLAVQWLNETLCFVSSSVVADSFRLRNRQLLVAAKRQSVKKLSFNFFVNILK
ncbi:MAG: hypothetical protein EAZ53_02770 [Bacteroidetes bacterium]|nr:MAG: hypothetical protein EAZ53_02770 [Bacteroidota bacterium]